MESLRRASQAHPATIRTCPLPGSSAAQAPHHQEAAPSAEPSGRLQLIKVYKHAGHRSSATADVRMLFLGKEHSILIRLPG